MTASASEDGTAGLQEARASVRPARPDPDRARLCIVSRAERPPAEMIRFVAGPGQDVFPDLARKLPGRGVWVTATKVAVAEAVRRNLFTKGLKQPARAAKDLPDRVEALLVAEARQALSLANKAGLVTTGFAKVDHALANGSAVLLITASDASIDGAGKLARKFKAIRGAAGRDAPIFAELTSAELNLAFGGLNVIHAAVAAGALGERVRMCCQRLRHYRGAQECAADDGAADDTAADDNAAGTTGAGPNGALGIDPDSNPLDQAGTDYE